MRSKSEPPRRQSDLLGRFDLPKLDATVTFGLLLLTVASSVWFRSNAAELAAKKAPAAIALEEAYAGVQRSLAALRGWVSVGQSSFREERDQAWTEEIEPQMVTVQQLSATWSSAEQQELRQLQRSLERLSVSQWFVEDVARTPGNHAVQFAFHQRARPIAQNIRRAVGLLSEPPSGSASGRDVAGRWNSFHHAFQNLELAYITAEQSSGHSLLALTELRGDAEQRLEEAAKETADAPERAELIRFVAREFRGYRVVTDQMLPVLQRGDEGVAQRLLRSETMPLAKEITTTLSRMSKREVHAMRTMADRVVSIGAALVWIGFTLLVVIIIIRMVARLPTGPAAAAAAPPDLPPDSRGGGLLGRLEAQVTGAGRVTALWFVIPVWLGGVLLALRMPTLVEASVALGVAFAVGSLLNTLNWLPVPAGRGARVVWVLRFAGNYAVPFTVSSTSMIMSSLG